MQDKWEKHIEGFFDWMNNTPNANKTLLNQVNYPNIYWDQDIYPRDDSDYEWDIYDQCFEPH